MDIDDVPIIGKIHRTMTMLIVNFALLAIIFIALGIIIPFYPRVLDYLIAALLIISGLIFLSTAYHVYTYKKKYFKWFDK